MIKQENFYCLFCSFLHLRTSYRGFASSKKSGILFKNFSKIHSKFHDYSRLAFLLGNFFFLLNSTLVARWSSRETQDARRFTKKKQSCSTWLLERLVYVKVSSGISPVLTSLSFLARAARCNRKNREAAREPRRRDARDCVIAAFTRPL